MTKKKKKLHEAATGNVQEYMKTHKGNIHLTKFHTKSRVVWPDNIYEYT